jgi:Domain of unknown function (DUF3943)
VKNAFAFFCVLWMGYSQAQIHATGDTRFRKICVLKTYPPHYDTMIRSLVLRNQAGPFYRKFFRATGLVLTVEAGEMTVLLISPKNFSQWNRSQLGDVKNHYKMTFTRPPVIDNDSWAIDYIGHPYQGAFNYNAIRSQGASIWQSALFATLHSTLWEYIIEGSEERPSIQDLIVTPVAGSLLGELIHFATMRMSKNGFTWYEGIFVCVFNPSFALNNGFKFASPQSSKLKPL